MQCEEFHNIQILRSLWSIFSVSVTCNKYLLGLISWTVLCNPAVCSVHFLFISLQTEILFHVKGEEPVLHLLHVVCARKTFVESELSTLQDAICNVMKWYWILSPNFMVQMLLILSQSSRVLNILVVSNGRCRTKVC